MGNAIEAYEILQLSCELLAERAKLIGSTKECPPDLVSSISTIIWAADRVEIPELSTVKKQFLEKYGKKFEGNALSNVGGILNQRVVSKISLEPPSAHLVNGYLMQICEQFDVDWRPKNPLPPDEITKPMMLYGVVTGTMDGVKGDYDKNDNGGGRASPTAVARPVSPLGSSSSWQ